MQNRLDVLKRHIFPDTYFEQDNQFMLSTTSAAIVNDSPLVNFGAHRVIQPRDALPQAANCVNNTPKLLHQTELLLEVDYLLLDSTSMRQIRESCDGKQIKMVHRIEEIINTHGKMHNPVTLSGGVLKGRVKQVGTDFEEVNGIPKGSLKVGQPVIPCVSISTIPLHVDKVTHIEGNYVYLTKSTAIVFSCMPITIIPQDINEKCALACIDISSLVPQVKRTLIQVVEEKMKTSDRRVPLIVNILVVGCGNAGVAGLYAIRHVEKYFFHTCKLDIRFNVMVVDNNKGQVDWMSQLENGTLVDHSAHINAQKVYEMFQFVHEKTDGKLSDLSINVVNVSGTETSTVICTRVHGTVIWFSMATRFDSAALSTDTLGKDVTMIIGNGIADGQVEETFELVRAHPTLRHLMEIGH